VIVEERDVSSMSPQSLARMMDLEERIGDRLEGVVPRQDRRKKT